MLNEKQILVCELIAKGLTIVDVAKESCVARSTIYEWKKIEEFNAEVDRLVQEILTATRARCQNVVPEALDAVVKVMRTDKYAKNRLAAAFDILDRGLGKATTKIETTTTDSKERVSIDVLDQELNEFENE